MSGLLERFHSGDRQALARILTHVENHSDLGKSALQQLSQGTGNAHLVGLTGPPGTGKSTLANALVRELRRRGQTIAVLAIDPSSPISGGATLGDRIRMLESQDDDGVFIRSMASRGQVGGLAIAAFGSATVLDAFGFDIIVIETVGTGQDEVDIASLADTVVLLQTPGQGDSVQAVKAGVLEIADVLVVNKADLPDADDLVHDLQQMLRMGEQRDWTTSVIPTISTAQTGIGELADEIQRHYAFLKESGRLASRRTERARHHARMLALGKFNQWLTSSTHGDERPNGDPVEMSESYLIGFAEEFATGERSRLQESVSDSPRRD